VQHATDGNPLFVEELTEHLLAGGFGTDRHDGGLPVPDGVQATIDRRVVDLADGARSLLRAGATLGRTFEVDLAGRLVDMNGDELLTATEDALLSGLVGEVSANHLMFAHALTQAAVYEATSTRRRLELHRRAAMALEGRVSDAPADAATTVDIARHWTIVASADPAAALSAARWAVRAGDAAAASADIDQAITRYEQADALLVGSTTEHADTLVRLGAALAAVGRSAEADERFRGALRIAEALDDPVLQARAALGLAGTLRYGRSDPERIGALEAVIARLGPGDNVLRPAAQAMLMRQLGFERGADAYRRRQDAAAGVLAAVTTPPLPDELLLALGASRDSIPVDDPVVLGHLTRAQIQLASARRELGVLANAWYGRAWSTLELGDAAGWAEAVAGYTEVAAELGLPYERAMASTMAATTALLEGRYAESAERADEARERSVGSGDENADAVHLTNMVIQGLDHGEAAVMVELMLSVEADYENVPTFTGGLAITAALAGDRALCARLLGPWGESAFTDVRRDAEWLPVIGFFAFAAGRIGHERYAQALYDLLAPAPFHTVRVGPLSGWWGPVDHHLGVLCAVLGRREEAERCLRSALVVEDALGARPFRARTLVELARLTPSPGDREALATEAKQVAAAIGAAGIEKDADDVLAEA
jgi:tetratricopeptide (TPR) repeat protein